MNNRPIRFVLYRNYPLKFVIFAVILTGSLVGFSYVKYVQPELYATMFNFPTTAPVDPLHVVADVAGVIVGISIGGNLRAGLGATLVVAAATVFLFNFLYNYFSDQICKSLDTVFPGLCETAAELGVWAQRNIENLGKGPPLALSDLGKGYTEGQVQGVCTIIGGGEPVCSRWRTGTDAGCTKLRLKEGCTIMDCNDEGPASSKNMANTFTPPNLPVCPKIKYKKATVKPYYQCMNVNPHDSIFLSGGPPAQFTYLNNTDDPDNSCQLKCPEIPYGLDLQGKNRAGPNAGECRQFAAPGVPWGQCMKKDTTCVCGVSCQNCCKSDPCTSFAQIIGHCR